jgi:hypothetical protein
MKFVFFYIECDKDFILIHLFLYFLRLMFNRSKFNRLFRHQYYPEIIIIINTIIIIYLCNTYYEYTGNQYILRDKDFSSEFCPLYPSTLKGKGNMKRNLMI